jgi:hypothetical protein
MSSLVGARILNDNLTTLPNSQRMAYPVSKPKLLDIPTYDGSGACVHPSVCIPQSPSGVFGSNAIGWHRWWMAMTPFANSDSTLENPSILCSDDGINWFVPTGVTNPIVPPIRAEGNNWYNADPNLTYNPFDGYMYLFWNAQGENINPEYPGVKTIGKMIKSKNGVTWSEPVDTMFVNSNGVQAPIGFGGSGIECLANGTWIAFINSSFGGNSQTLGEGNMRLLMSDNGITWKEMPSTYDNLAGSHWHCSFRRFSDGYHFISSVANNESKSAYNLRLHYGYSPDGQSPLFDGTPLFGIDGENFPTKKWYASCVVPTGQETARVYFSGMSTDDDWRIGYFDIKLNNPYMIYANSPLAKARYRALWHWYELRDTDSKVSAPLYSDQTSYYGVREMIWNKENAIHIVNTLKGADGKGVSVKLEVINRLADATRVVTIDETAQEVDISSSGYVTVITKDKLKALGVRHLSRTGFRITASAVPTSGTFSAYIVPQE